MDLSEPGPFTEFGQFGPGIMDNRVFDQGEYWVDCQGVPHRISEMSFEYLANVVMFLREDAAFFYVNTVRRKVMGMVLGDAEVDSDALNSLLEQEPGAWIESNPLMISLLAAVEASS
jgi:hypothetical protein